MRIVTLMFLHICASGAALAQALPVATPAAELLKLPSLDAVLAKLQPPVNKAQIAKSDYLLLDAPEIAQAGSISVRMMSEIPGTDLFMLFDANPQPGKPALLALQPVPAANTADVKLQISLVASTELLLLARANGRVFSAVREVKLAVKEKK